MLSEFYLAVEDFTGTAKACDRALAQRKGTSHIQRARMADLAQDISAFAESMARAHINATMWITDGLFEAASASRVRPPNFEDWRSYVAGKRDLDRAALDAIEQYIENGKQVAQRMIRRSESKAAARADDAKAELKACYKSYFFFIRAFHDAAYGVLLNLCGQTAGAYSSMNKCIAKRVHPVFERIEAIPGYVEWFAAFRQKRDRIKRGQNFSLQGPQWDVGVGFNEITDEGGVVVDVSGSRKFDMSDLIEAICYSHELVRLVERSVVEP